MRMKGHEVYVRQVDQSNYHRVLEDLKIKEFFNIIVDIRPERMVDLLNVVIPDNSIRHRQSDADESNQNICHRVAKQ